VLRPIGHEGELRDFAIADPFGGDQLGALKRPAVQQPHTGVFGVNLTKLVPGQPAIFEVETASQSHFWPR